MVNLCRVIWDGVRGDAPRWRARDGVLWSSDYCRVFGVKLSLCCRPLVTGSETARMGPSRGQVAPEFDCFRTWISVQYL